MPPLASNARIDRAELSRVTAALRLEDWSIWFDGQSRQRGKTLYQRGAVTLTEVSRGPDDEVRSLAVVASQSSRFGRYEVEITFTLGSEGLEIDSDCTCPVEFHCKHAVAAVYELIAASKFLRVAPPATEHAPEASATLGRQQQILAELRAQAATHGFNLEEILDNPASARTARAEATQTPLIREDPEDVSNLAAWEGWLQGPLPARAAPDRPPYEVDFCLSVSGQRLRVLTYARKPKAGTRPEAFKVLPDLWRNSHGDPWAEIAPEDQAPLRLLLGCPRAHEYGPERVLMGPHGRQTLDALMARGCRFAAQPAGTPKAGDLRSVLVEWKLAEDGSQRLTVSAPPSGALVHIDGLCYVDTVTGEIGPVAGISANELERITRAPALRPAVRERLGPLLAEAAILPAPKMVSTHRHTRIAHAELQVIKAPAVSTHAGAPVLFGARLGFRYDDQLVDGEDLRHPAIFLRGDVRHVIERDDDAEYALRMAVRKLGLVRFAERYQVHVPLLVPATGMATADVWLRLAESLNASGVVVVFDREFPLQLLPEADGWFADLTVKEGTPWFDLELGIRMGEEQVSLLPMLVKALTSKTLTLIPSPNERPDATWLAPIDAHRRVRLPLAKIRDLLAPVVEWLESLGHGNALTLPLVRADLADAYSGMDLQVRAANTLRQLSQALAAVSGHATVVPPDTFKGLLRDYQLDGLVWLDFLGRHQLGGLLADDMGLGKTIQVVAHLLSEKAQGRLQAPVLIVMPTSLVPNWQSELARFAPTLSVLTLHGDARREQFARSADFDVVLTTYALLPGDGDAWRERAFDLVVYDEAQALKNPLAKAAVCARRLQARRRLAMTGTPVENHLGELWAQVDLVLPGLLGARRDFSTHFRTPIEKHQDLAQRDRLSRRLRPFLLRRNKHQVARELPEKTDIVQRVELEGAQRELYESLRLTMHARVRQAIQQRGVAQSSIVVLDALLKLRQVCCDPLLVKLPAARKVRNSAKRTALFDLLDPLLDAGRRVLLFSQFTEMLDLIQTELSQNERSFVRLDGQTRDRAAPIQAFQSGSVPLMLISLKAGGVGLNLTAADTVIHYDPWWNPAVEQQATDRAHRIGQDKPVFVYKLVCRDTVEDKIIALQARKAELASAILDNGSSTSLQFDEATIEELLGAG